MSMLSTKTIALLLALLGTSAAHAQEGGGGNKKASGQAIGVSGRDIGKITRVIVDGMPKDGYSLDPINQGLNIQFRGLSGTLNVDTLSPGGLASRIKQAAIKPNEDGSVTLALDYTCDCQAEVYDFQRKKLIIDIFGNEAVRNPEKPSAIDKPTKSIVTAEKQIKAKEAQLKDALPPEQQIQTIAAAAVKKAPEGVNVADKTQSLEDAPESSVPEAKAASNAPEAKPTKEISAAANKPVNAKPVPASKAATSPAELRAGLWAALQVAKEGGVVRFKSVPPRQFESAENAAAGGASGGKNAANKNADGVRGDAGSASSRRDNGGNYLLNGRDNGAHDAVTRTDDVVRNAVTRTDDVVRDNVRDNAGSQVGGRNGEAGRASDSRNGQTRLDGARLHGANNSDAGAINNGAAHNGATPNANNGAQNGAQNGEGSEAGVVDPDAPAVKRLSANLQTVIPGAPSDTGLEEDGDVVGRCLPDDALKFKLPHENAFKADEHTARVDFYDSLTDYKGRLISEFDRSDPEAALQLAQYYTTYGFGDEAIGVLSGFSVPEQRGRVVHDMAELFTDRKPSIDSIFNVGNRCDGVHRMWSAYWSLKRGNIEHAARVALKMQPEADIEAFPKTLRLKVGTDLALALARNKNFAEAGRLVDIVAEGDDQYNPKVLLVRGMIEGEHGNAEPTIARLAGIVHKDQRHDGDAASALAELKISQGVDLNEDDLSGLEETAFLQSRHRDGATAVALLARSVAAKDDYYGAFQRLAHSEYKSKERGNPIFTESALLFRTMAEKGKGFDNPQNLQVYWEFPNLIPKDPKVLRAFAKRLVDSGYDASALEVYRNIRTQYPAFVPTGGVVEAEAQVLLRLHKADDMLALLQRYPGNVGTEQKLDMAKAYLQKQQPLQAAAVLRDLNQPEAVKLRAQAAWQAGDWKNASRDYADPQAFAGDTAAAHRAEAASYMASDGAAVPTTPAAASKSADKVLKTLHEVFDRG